MDEDYLTRALTRWSAAAERHANGSPTAAFEAEFWADVAFDVAEEARQ